ncbi:MAG: hypothetical protein KAQ87_04660 [Candidatus Pacebacteria bacterium]|nr:hypothetical protein [Candidatus Paceibacterota bacterium]
MSNKIKNLNQNSGQNKNQKRSSEKEPLSLMTVKTLLVVLIFTALAVIIIICGYLISLSDKTDLPITDPVIKTQCKIDSDCRLAYTGSNICLSCDTSVEEYKCLSLEEAKKIEEKRLKRMVDDNIFCERCLEKPQHICVCSNGKCEKVKEGLVEEVIITTDKIEYEQGENVKIAIENNSDKEQKISYPPYVIERFENNNWAEIKQIWCPCGAYCEEAEWLFIKPKDKLEYEWNQVKSWCGNINGFWGEFSSQVQFGKYRIKSIKIGFPDPESYETVYSDEFTIKEKTALDLRCGEKVKFDSLCHMSKIIKGYEFDPSLNKRMEVNVHGGCSFETPFQTLEECQEVCEKRENCAKTGEMVYASHIVFEKPLICCNDEDGIKSLRQLLPNGSCQIDVPLNGAIGKCVLKNKESYKWGSCRDGICGEDENRCNCPEDCGEEIDERFYCEKNNDCLATCSSPGCYNENWYKTVMRGDCEMAITHSCRCIENDCIKQPLLKEDIEVEIRKSNYCDIKDDCARVNPSCSLGCDVIVNKDKVERINKLIDIIKGKCSADCGGVETDLACVNNKCMVLR